LLVHRLARRFLLSPLLLCASVAFAADGRAVVKRVSPIYPELARRMHISGLVVLQVTIQPDGKVSDAKVQSGHALLAPAAEDAVRQWHFAPGPDSTQTTVDVTFNDSSR
jgi:TonB family protein